MSGEAASTHPDDQAGRPGAAVVGDADAIEVPSTDGVTVTVHDLGGSGPPLLLCHATGFHAMVWRPVARHLADRFHSLAPDLRGHGDSPAPEDLGFAWRGFADDVLAVVEQLGLYGCVAAGHSKGGAALLLAEQARPGTFRALYCYEPVVMPPELRSVAVDGQGPENPLASAALRRRPTFGSTEEAEANYRSKPPMDAFHPDALSAYVEHGFAPTPEGGIILKCRPEVEAQVYRMGGSHDAFDHLDAVRCPVTVAAGRIEPFSPSGWAAAVADALPAGRLEQHPELGHFGPMEDPAAIAEAIAVAVHQPVTPPA